MPLGLVLASWGGTTDRTWSSPRALSRCPDHTGSGGYRTNKTLHHDSELWNSMVSPMLSMAMRGVVWYQGEADAYDPRMYNCTFSQMIDDWCGSSDPACVEQCQPRGACALGPWHAD